MTAFERLRRTQRILGAAAMAQAITWGFAVALSVIALASFASLADPDLSRHPIVVHDLSLLAGFVIGGAFLWRSRRLAYPKRVALWIEERVPDLRYAFVTALEDSESLFSPDMERVVAKRDVGSATLKAIRRPILMAVAALIVAIALLYLSPPSAFGRAHAFAPLTDGRAGAGPAGSRLEGIEVRINPPGYTGQRATVLRDPSSVAALTGSAITVRGRGPVSGLTAATSGPLAISAFDGGWSVSLTMPANPAALRLTDRDYEKIIVLAPTADAAPKIVLSSPVHDTALRAPRLVVQLSATATDDVGLGEGHFEYMITTGSGEIFSARTVNTPVVRFGGSRSGSMTATLDLATLKLVEGDIVSMRAIAQDNNNLSGPGVATSDTRTIRIVRASEYDSLAIEAAAPPPLDSSVVSQRMLVLMAEKLVKDQPRLARAELVKRSTDIGELEDRIRRRVREILADGEETPIQEHPDSMAATVEQMEGTEEPINGGDPDLKTAYNALWEAIRALRIAEPSNALPPMRVALKSLDRARLANRVYLRGTPPRIIVDLKRVRLSGKEKGSSNTRSPRSFADSVRARLSARFDALVEMIDKDPARTVSELAMMRVDALTSLPDAAAALAEVSDAIRAGSDATLPLLRARRAIDGPPVVVPSLTPWSSGGQ